MMAEYTEEECLLGAGTELCQASDQRGRTSILKSIVELGVYIEKKSTAPRWKNNK